MKTTSYILIVEDDADSCLYYKIVLERMKYNIIISSVVSNVVQICMNKNIIIVLLDIVMKNMNAVEILNKIKTYNSNTIVIAQTGMTSLKKEDFIRLGFDDFFYKPIKKKHLEKLIQKHTLIINYN